MTAFARVWIPGGTGMLGCEIRDRLDALGIACEPTDSRAVDITHSSSVEGFAKSYRPTLIINCAAYTNVDRAEAEAEQAHAVNTAGPAHLAVTGAQIGATLVHLSSDYVFDGQASEPYEENDKVAPLGVYGASKLGGEEAVNAVAAAAPDWRWFIVRTSWLFGQGAMNFVRRMFELMDERESLRVVSDQYGRPTSTVDLAEAVLRLVGADGSRSAKSGIYHFANEGQTTWHGLAQRTWKQASAARPLKCQRVDAIVTADYPTPAQRPAFSVLDTRKIQAAIGYTPRTWQQAHDAYVAQLLNEREAANA